LIDTSLLFPFLIWQFSQFAHISVDHSVLAPITSVHLQEALRWYLDFAKPIRTSPHVIAEIHGLVKSRAKWKGARVGDFWRFAHDKLSSLGLQEELVRVEDMEVEALAEFGPTDASILTLANLTLAKKRRTVVLTEDPHLRGKCALQEISVLSCWDVLAEWQKNQV
jgi:tetrahydromethanopterin S-methyltransferase subunit H